MLRVVCTYYKICLFSCLLIANSIAQTNFVISGKVHDSNNLFLEWANLILYENTTGDILAYTSTDANGQYKISAIGTDHQVYLLVGSFLGFTPDSLEFRFQKGKSEYKFDLMLSSTKYELDPVEITDMKLPYRVNGDTIDYEAAYYADGLEKSLEDLVRKIPGVKVTNEGDIHFKGKKVKQVLLEKDALFGRNYSIGTRSMGADVIDRIQFIDHYIENPLLQGIKDSEDLVMNVSLKAERKSLFFGSSEVGIGIPGKYDLGLNIFSMVNNLKIFAPVKLNNTGNPTLTLDEYFIGDNQGERVIEGVRSPMLFSEINMSLPFNIAASRFRKNNRSNFEALNMVFSPSDNMKIKLYGLRFQDAFTLSGMNEFKELGSAYQTEFQEQNSYNDENEGRAMNAEIHYQINQNSNLEATSHIGFADGRKELTTQVHSGDRDQIIRQQLTIQNPIHRHGLKYTRKTSQNEVLSFDAKIVKGTLPQKLLFNPWMQTEESVDLFNGIQEIKHEIEDLDVGLNYLAKIGNWKYSLSLRYSSNRDSLMSTLNKRPDISIGEFDNDSKLLQRKTFLYTSIDKTFNTTKISMHTELGYQNAIMTIPGLKDKSLAKPIFNTGINLKSKLSSFFVLAQSLSFNNTQLSISDLHPGYIYRQYRNLTLGSDSLKFDNSLSGFTLLTYNDRFRLLDAMIHFSWNINNSHYDQQYEYLDLTSITRRKIIGPKKLILLKADFLKYLPFLESNIGLGFQYLKSNYYLANPDIIRTKQSSLIYDISMNSSWQHYPNIGLKLRYIESQFSQKIKSRDNSVSHLNLQYFLSYRYKSTFVGKLIVDHYFHRSPDFENRDFIFVNLDARIKLNASYQIRIEVRNLMNLNSYEKLSYGSHSSEYFSYQLERRSGLLYLEFNF